MHLPFDFNANGHLCITAQRFSRSLHAAERPSRNRTYPRLPRRPETTNALLFFVCQSLYERTDQALEFFHGLLCHSGHGRYSLYIFKVEATSVYPKITTLFPGLINHRIRSWFVPLTRPIDLYSL